MYKGERGVIKDWGLKIVTYTVSKYHKIFISVKAVVKQTNMISYHCLGGLPQFCTRRQAIKETTSRKIPYPTLRYASSAAINIFRLACIKTVVTFLICCVFRSNN